MDMFSLLTGQMTIMSAKHSMCEREIKRSGNDAIINYLILMKLRAASSII
ncbi:hypothetical protein Peur_065808 [Populus x canadensis]